jgi:hypothetical protein
MRSTKKGGKIPSSIKAKMASSYLVFVQRTGTLIAQSYSGTDKLGTYTGQSISIRAGILYVVVRPQKFPKKV